MAPTSPKFIVAGGGPVGLTAALAFTKANIDFIVLERNASPIIDAGSNLVLNPAGTRALAQLGLMDELKKVTSILSDVSRINEHAQSIGNAHWFHIMQDTLGDSARVLSRHDLTGVIYNGLPESAREKILTNKTLTRVDETEEGVKVTCADGSTYEGTALIGADGAHSVTRREMRRLALEANSERVNEEKPFLTTFRALWIRFPTKGLMPAGVTCETHTHGAGTQMFSGEETAVAGVYQPLEKPTRDRVRFTQADQDAMVEKHGDMPLTEDGSVTLKSAYAIRTQSGLVSLEEGVTKYWSHAGKIVLIGDAAHKFTPSTGAGCNFGIVDVVVLANHLHALLRDTAATAAAAGGPSHTELEMAFQSFQAARWDEVVYGCAAAGGATCQSVWLNGFHKFFDKHILCYKLVQKLIVGMVIKQMAATPSFRFIEGKEQFWGSTPWVDPLEAAVAA